MQETNLELFPTAEPTIDIVPGRKLTAKGVALYAAPSDHFETKAVEELHLGFDGIAHDFHAGMTRRSGGREPWYPRGTEMRNERQLSLVATDELSIVAERMGLKEIKPEWIGANMLIGGVPHLSMLPAGSLMFFEGGVTIKIDAQNKPCRVAGQSIATHVHAPDRDAAALLFPQTAKRLRGLVAWVEKPGVVRVGEEISVRVPEQWIYKA
ncbi:molybdenum cofactor sulfurase [Mesorhizobium sp. LNHC220B00]|uniref:MOSC domain-containing protein n=1 Tax=Mesorhizobium sp. LNHC229A00 TaxID=1287240 RepID=UPI0003CF0F6F|nr:MULTISPECIES: MOSC domain-containing protein [unclassified Mesorhizobium]ESY86171.1 molybdenum cofactor sulfurase [Mesorhizobium sp. LNHC220B00]ESY97126.1 molybdenum cofactor sulfurase [Mesorhizobium sp. LNHC229A00]